MACGADITHRKGHATTCSKACASRLHNIRAGGRSAAARAADDRRRALKRGAGTAVKVNRLAVFERDEWTCRLCLGDVDPSVKHPHPLSKSLDHIVPLSLGGAHEPSNVQLAHLRCNIQKSNKVETDLAS
jgi:5-methylcytosine-specific restriction endonuclease McrA